MQKVLARAGFGSRRACEELIVQGRVTVRGRVVSLGDRVDVTTETIAVDGLPVSLDVDVVYYLLNKPAGVVTTARDPQGRTTVLDLVPREPRVFPVGRLDRDTAGLLILTNDGDFAMRVTHPRFGVSKTYIAEVQGHAGRRHAQLLRRGISLDDGPASADAVSVRAGQSRSFVELTVHEGRNRIVRRMLAEVGLPVVSLTRVAIGPLTIGRLKPGAHRSLSRQEVGAVVKSIAHPDGP